MKMGVALLVLAGSFAHVSAANDMVVFGSMGCCACLSFAGFLAFVIVVSSWTHLGPNEQVVIKGAGGKKRAINGPYSAYLGLGQKEYREATLLDASEYVYVQERSGLLRYEEGPQLLFLGGEDRIRGTVEPKIVLQADDYLRLVDRQTGRERVLRGPQAVVPLPTEYQLTGPQKAIYVDTETAVVVQNRNDGRQRLVTELGIFAPSDGEEVLGTRSLYRVSPHEAVLVREGSGQQKIYSGSGNGGAGTSFFLPPYAQIVRLYWSSFGEPELARGRYTSTTTPSTGTITPSTGTTTPTGGEGVPPGGAGVPPRSLGQLASRSTNDENSTVVTKENSTGLARKLQSTANVRMKKFECTAAACYWSSYTRWVEYNPLNQSNVDLDDCMRGCSANQVLGRECTGIEWPRDGSYCMLWLRRRCDVMQTTGNGGWHISEWQETSLQTTMSPVLTCSVVSDAVDYWASARSAAQAAGIVQIRGTPDPWGKFVNGFYVYQPSGVNTAPSFKKEDGSAWLFVSLTGRWWVGTDASKRAREAHGWIRSDVIPPGSGRLPETFTTWQLPPYDMWEQQGAIQVTRTRVKPATNNVGAQSELTGVKRAVTDIDLRVQKCYYSYETRTNDNVKVQLDGIIFWRIVDIPAMLRETSDPEGDLWYKSRSSLVQAVSNVSLDIFMQDMQSIIKAASDVAIQEGFFRARGLQIDYIELTGYTYLNPRTLETLQRIIRETTNRLVDVSRAATENDVKAAALVSDIALEAERSQLIEAQALNSKLMAAGDGVTEGSLQAMGISAFIDNLEEALPNLDDRLRLYRHLYSAAASNVKMANLARGSVDLWVMSRKNFSLWLG